MLWRVNSLVVNQEEWLVGLGLRPVLDRVATNARFTRDVEKELVLGGVSKVFLPREIRVQVAFFVVGRVPAVVGFVEGGKGHRRQPLHKGGTHIRRDPSNCSGRLFQRNRFEFLVFALNVPIIDGLEAKHLLVAVHGICVGLVEPQLSLLDLQLGQLRHGIGLRMISRGLDHWLELVPIDLQAKVQILLDRGRGRWIIAVKDVITVNCGRDWEVPKVS